MSCPFYGASILFREHGGTGRVYQPLGSVVDNNRCGLIASAHSPCWMEVGEKTPPDWERCPRNPEHIAQIHTPGVGDLVEAVRFLASVEWLQAAQNAGRVKS